MHLPTDALAVVALHLPLSSLVNFACTCKIAKQVALAESQMESRLAQCYNLDIRVWAILCVCYMGVNSLHVVRAGGSPASCPFTRRAKIWTADEVQDDSRIYEYYFIHKAALGHL